MLWVAPRKRTPFEKRGKIEPPHDKKKKKKKKKKNEMNAHPANAQISLGMICRRSALNRSLRT